MSNRINIPFTNEHFAAWCQKMLGQPYWYGTVVYKCSESVRTSKSKQYPSHYGSSRTSRYKQDIAAQKICADCVGGCKGYAWTGGGIGVIESIGTGKTYTNRYGANGCPDKSANGMFSYAKSKGMDWGTIGTMPEIVGLALHKEGHVGYYIGGGYAVEWRGFSYGCVKTKVSSRGWTHWYKLPFIQYTNETTGTRPNTTLGNRLLKNGMTGADVKALQELLLQLGYRLPEYGADGDYGDETEQAVLTFQKAEGLEQDGKYGDKTHAALMAAVSDDDKGKQDEVNDEPESPQPKPVGTAVIIASDNGKVNIRVGNGTQYALITTVAAGAAYEYVATAANGWNAVVVGAQIGWVSGLYSKVV